MADYTDILYETDGPVAYLTLNRPEKLNALSNTLRGEMVHALKEAESDPAVHVVLLRAAGRSFSAGYDIGGGRAAAAGSPFVHPRSRLPDVGSTRPGPVEWAAHVTDTNLLIWELYKPVVAQVQGRPDLVPLPAARAQACEQCTLAEHQLAWRQAQGLVEVNLQRGEHVVPGIEGCGLAGRGDGVLLHAQAAHFP